MSRGKSLLSGMAIAAVGALASSCGGGIGPGDYVVLRLAYSSPTYSSTCPQGDEKDTSTADTGVTEYLFAGPKQTFYLDTGSSGTSDTVLAGTSTSSGYTFAGTTTEVTPGIGGSETTTSTKVSVSMTVSGNAVNGTATSVATSSCTVSCGGFTGNTCTTTIVFAGSMIQNVQLQQGVP